jgi:Sulfotransferase domain
VTAVRLVTGTQVAGRAATIFPDDVYLVSYPRSGNTWTRFLMANLLDPEHPATFADIESRVAEIYFNYDHVMRRLPRPRLLKSHEAFIPRYPRVIYIVRDPRDVAVSFYHHNVKWRNIPEDYPIDDFIPGFIAAQYDPWSGSWGDNVKSWISMRQGSSSFLLLRYEDLKQDTQRELLRVGDFLREAGFPRIETSPEKLAQAIERSSPERMRALEKEQTRQHVQLKRTRQDKPFIRTATSGGWRSALSEASVALIEGAWGDLMESMGYPLSRVLQEVSVDPSRRG